MLQKLFAYRELPKFAVLGESPSGKVHCLKKGFESFEAAEDHPIIMRHWKRVWVVPEGDIEREQKAGKIRLSDNLEAQFSLDRNPLSG